MKFIELIYFNKKLPENHIFCSANLNNKMVKVYDTALKKPKAALKINIYNSILFNSIEKINSTMIKMKISKKIWIDYKH